MRWEGRGVGFDELFFLGWGGYSETFLCEISLFCVFINFLEAEMEREGYALVIHNVLITSDIVSKNLCRCEIFIVQEGDFG